MKRFITIKYIPNKNGNYFKIEFSYSYELNNKYKGIEVEIINEAYTSKASALDKDEIKEGNYSGKRIKRGLYQIKNGFIINADKWSIKDNKKM